VCSIVSSSAACRRPSFDAMLEDAPCLSAGFLFLSYVFFPSAFSCARATSFLLPLKRRFFLAIAWSASYLALIHLFSLLVRSSYDRQKPPSLPRALLTHSERSPFGISLPPAAGEPETRPTFSSSPEISICQVLEYCGEALASSRKSVFSSAFFFFRNSSPFCPPRPLFPSFF